MTIFMLMQYNEMEQMNDDKDQNLTDFATKPYGITVDEFHYIESKVNNSTREILSVLKDTNGDIEKTIKILKNE